MNKKRWLAASILVFIVVTILEFISNGFLKNIYMQTMHLWRPEADMIKLMPYYWISSFIASFIFAYIYTKGYEAKPCAICEGFRFGLLFGLFINPPMVTICYATMPIGLNLVVGWFVTGMIQYIVAGMVVGLIYKEGNEAKSCCCC